MSLVLTTLSHSKAAIDTTLDDGLTLLFSSRQPLNSQVLPLFAGHVHTPQDADALDAGAWAVVSGTAITHHFNYLLVCCARGLTLGAVGFLVHVFKSACEENDPHLQLFPDIVIITGMSGSGRTQALHAEDRVISALMARHQLLFLQLSNLVGINTVLAALGRYLRFALARSFDDISEALRSLADLTHLQDCLSGLFRRSTYRRYKRESPKSSSFSAEGKSLICNFTGRTATGHKLADVVLDTSSMRTNTAQSRLPSCFRAC